MLAKLPLTSNELTPLSAAMKQLCIYLKHANLQEQAKLSTRDARNVEYWIGYWLQSGVSPLILLPGFVYTRRFMDATLSDPNFYLDAVDGLRSMIDGTLGFAKVETSSLGGSVIDFVGRRNRFMAAWCAKAMGGEGSNEYASIIGPNNLLYECIVNREFGDMTGFDLEWIRMFWGRMATVVKDPTFGPSKNTTVRDWLDRSKPLVKSLLGNRIFDTCREACWYVVQGLIKSSGNILSIQTVNPQTFFGLIPTLKS